MRKKTVTEIADRELLEKELEREWYKGRYRSIFRSTAFMLTVAAAIAERSMIDNVSPIVPMSITAKYKVMMAF